MSFESLINATRADGGTCTIQTKSNDFNTNEDGTISETWVDTYTSVECAIQKITVMGTLLEDISGLNPETRFVLFLKYDQTISRGNRVIKDGITYFVENIDIVGDHHREIILRLLEV